MGKSCWMARLAIQILRFQLLPDFIIFSVIELEPGSPTYCFPAFFIYGTHNVPGFKLRVRLGHMTRSSKGPFGRQKAQGEAGKFLTHLPRSTQLCKQQ